MTRTIFPVVFLAGSTVWFAGCARAPQQAGQQPGEAPRPEYQAQAPQATPSPDRFVVEPSTAGAASRPPATAERTPAPQALIAPEAPSKPSAMSARTGARAAEPRLATRPAEPNPEPAIMQSPAIHLPAGAMLRVRTMTALSTKTARPGDTFTATLIEPYKGATAIGRVVDSNPGGRVKGVAHLSVRLMQIRFADGRTLDIQTGAIERKARTTRKRDALKIGAGSGIGAGIGAIAAGGVGAAIGAAAGGAAGTGYVLSTRGVPAVIPSESVLTFRLSSAARR